MLLALCRCAQNSRLPRRWLARHGMHRQFTVLALESSADDTCAAVVTSDRKILANVVLKQHSHEAYGGIEPMVAIKEHHRNMPLAIRQALDISQIKLEEIDGIAFTRGPGMYGCLSVCTAAAKSLAAALQKPLVGVHHMQAHALTALLTSPSLSSPLHPSFPFLTLLISGGHTLLLLALSPSRFRVLASTVDEAVGSAIDAAARAVRVRWKGQAPGAALETLAREGLPGAEEAELARITNEMPKPKKVLPGELRFSFAGLHSWVDRYVLEHGREMADGESDEEQLEMPAQTRPHKVLRLPDVNRVALARAFQDAAFAQLEEKVVIGLRWCETNRASILRDGLVENQLPQSEAPSDADSKSRLAVRHVVVSGGVASNALFRERLTTCLKKTFPEQDLKLVFPPPDLCTDNAAMIGWAAMHRFVAGESDDYSIDHRRKWNIEDLGDEACLANTSRRDSSIQ